MFIVELDNKPLSIKSLYNLFVELDKFYIPPISSQKNLMEYSKKLLKNGKVFCLKEKTEKLVGVIAIYVNDIIENKAFISSIGILPEYYGSGIAQSLLVKANEVAMICEMVSISLEVSPENHRAIAFYKKNGFFESSKKPNILIMKKDL